MHCRCKSWVTVAPLAGPGLFPFPAVLQPHTNMVQGLSLARGMGTHVMPFPAPVLRFQWSNQMRWWQKHGQNNEKKWRGDTSAISTAPSQLRKTLWVFLSEFYLGADGALCRPRVAPVHSDFCWGETSLRTRPITCRQSLEPVVLH